MKHYAEYIRFIFQFSYFIFPISSSILFIYSYSHTILYFFLKFDLFVIVIIPMYHASQKRMLILSIWHVYVFSIHFIN